MSWTTSLYPAVCKLAAILPPIVPSPTKPTNIVSLVIFLHSRVVGVDDRRDHRNCIGGVVGSGSGLAVLGSIRRHWSAHGQRELGPIPNNQWHGSGTAV